MDEHSLDYAAVSPEYARLYAQVRRRDRWLHARLFAMLALGAAATMVGPVIVAAVFCAVLRETTRIEHAPLLATAVVASLVVVPLLFLFERRTRGQFFADEIRDQTF